MRYKRGYHYRCSDRKCHTRHTFLRLLDTYIRPKKCKWCSGTKFYRDKYRDNIEINVKPCQCDGYGHVALRDPSPPHRVGSKCCEYRKDGTKRLPGDPDWYNPHASDDLYDAQYREDYHDSPEATQGVLEHV